MRHTTPIHTFWSIIGMTLAALVAVHLLDVPGDRAMPIFVIFMLLGVPIGEIAERYASRSKPK